jgi:hypothetical protein
VTDAGRFQGPSASLMLAAAAYVCAALCLHEEHCCSGRTVQDGTLMFSVSVCLPYLCPYPALLRRPEVCAGHAQRIPRSSWCSTPVVEHPHRRQRPGLL